MLSLAIFARTEQRVVQWSDPGSTTDLRILWYRRYEYGPASATESWQYKMSLTCHVKDLFPISENTTAKVGLQKTDIEDMFEINREKSG